MISCVSNINKKRLPDGSFFYAFFLWKNIVHITATPSNAG